MSPYRHGWPLRCAGIQQQRRTSSWGPCNKQHVAVLPTSHVLLLLLLLLLSRCIAGCTAYAFCKDPSGCGTGCSAHVGRNPGGKCPVDNRQRSNVSVHGSTHVLRSCAHCSILLLWPVSIQRILAPSLISCPQLPSINHPLGLAMPHAPSLPLPPPPPTRPPARPPTCPSTLLCSHPSQ